LLAAGDVGAFFSKFDNFSSGFRFWLGSFVLGFCRQKGTNNANLLARLNRKKQAGTQPKTRHLTFTTDIKYLNQAHK